MCEHWSCSGRKAIITQISSFAVSSSRYPYQETYQLASEKVCVKCGRVFRCHVPYDKWIISKDVSPHASDTSNAVKNKTWDDTILAPDSIFSIHSTFHLFDAKLLMSIPFFVPFVFVMILVFPSHIFSWGDTISLAIIIIAVLYLIFGNPRKRKERYVKIDGTLQSLRFPTENFLDVWQTEDVR